MHNVPIRENNRETHELLVMPKACKLPRYLINNHETQFVSEEENPVEDEV